MNSLIKSSLIELNVDHPQYKSMKKTLKNHKRDITKQAFTFLNFRSTLPLKIGETMYINY